MVIQQIKCNEAKERIARAILESLSEWFGIPNWRCSRHYGMNAIPVRSTLWQYNDQFFDSDMLC